MNIELTEIEKIFLTDFANFQHDGARDNVSTATPIHVVERLQKRYVPCKDGDCWVLENDYDYPIFDSFDELVSYSREHGEDDLPDYEDVAYTEVETADGETFIDSEETYLEVFGINALRIEIIKYYQPVAFFFIRKQAVYYMNEYQAHNCKDCRIYTYSLGYSNHGDLPVFRELLMRMGQELIKETECKNESL